MSHRIGSPSPVPRVDSVPATRSSESGASSRPETLADSSSASDTKTIQAQMGEQQISQQLAEKLNRRDKGKERETERESDPGSPLESDEARSPVPASDDQILEVGAPTDPAATATAPVVHIAPGAPLAVGGPVPQLGFFQRNPWARHGAVTVIVGSLAVGTTSATGAATSSTGMAYIGAIAGGVLIVTGVGLCFARPIGELLARGRDPM